LRILDIIAFSCSLYPDPSLTDYLLATILRRTSNQNFLPYKMTPYKKELGKIVPPSMAIGLNFAGLVVTVIKTGEAWDQASTKVRACGVVTGAFVRSLFLIYFL
jgi:hypothetical protein